MKRALIRLKTIAKDQRWKMRRRAVERKYGRERCQSAPVLFANAIPKAGSHLLAQIIKGMSELGPFVYSGRSAVTRDEGGNNLSDDDVLGRIMDLQPGDIAYGKLVCRPPFVEALTRPEIATVFIYRDPRDLTISRVRYATDMHTGHHLHHFFNHVLKTDEERIRCIIAGLDDPSFPYKGIRGRYLGYMGWLNQPVLSLRFEDLRSGNLRESLSLLLDFVAEKGYVPVVSREEALDCLENAIQPLKSGTFREGTSGQWKRHFSPEIKDLFKEKMGDLLIKYGYEKDDNW